MTDHPLDLLARAAYGAFAISSADRLGEMPPWDAIPPDAHADWRAVADAVQMMAAPHLKAAAELKANLQAAIERVERTAAAAQAKAVEVAVAAARERCAQLAGQAPDCAACNDTGRIGRPRWRRGAGGREYFRAEAPCACKTGVALRQGGEGGGT